MLRLRINYQSAWLFFPARPPSSNRHRQLSSRTDVALLVRRYEFPGTTRSLGSHARLLVGLSLNLTVPSISFVRFASNCPRLYITLMPLSPINFPLCSWCRGFAVYWLIWSLTIIFLYTGPRPLFRGVSLPFLLLSVSEPN